VIETRRRRDPGEEEREMFSAPGEGGDEGHVERERERMFCRGREKLRGERENAPGEGGDEGHVERVAQLDAPLFDHLSANLTRGQHFDPRPKL
jgi:hypothetical protein